MRQKLNVSTRASHTFRIVRRGLAEHPAEVQEVRLGGRALSRGDAARLVGELGQRELGVGRRGRRGALPRTGPRAAIRPGGGHMLGGSEGARADRGPSRPRCRVVRTGATPSSMSPHLPDHPNAACRDGRVPLCRAASPLSPDPAVHRGPIPHVVAPHADALTDGRSWARDPGFVPSEPRVVRIIRKSAPNKPRCRQGGSGRDARRRQAAHRRPTRHG